jgi:hypothetical protein
MSTIDFDKFDLDGMSLEDIEPKKAEKPQKPHQVEQKPEPKSVQVEEVIEVKPVQQSVEAEQIDKTENAKVPDGQMICPKCELEQPKAEQCSGCGVYVKKAQAQGQSKIQITSTKF